MQELQLQIIEFIANNTTAGTTLGEKLLEMQRQFPPFNFYYDKPEGMSTNHYLQKFKPVEFRDYFIYGQVKRWFLNLISQAQEFTKKGEAEKAIWIYETLIEHRYPNYKPYDLLIKLYRKQKDPANENRIINISIEFFTALRKNQKEYVLSLAREVGMKEKALEYINAGNKIEYYGGAFVLYDPVKVLEKWKLLNLKFNEKRIFKPI
ncbi:hypothetical protein [Dyadobacter sp. 3J3]|uniref:hypothetical protein n=1 Tax=Dyadobacter sp. 3J3 TaxID=2606600 RepID=UPI00135BA755|nr:hypothetical protein [Dyadobacter sp. 3J3]